ncbi:unnamed protein product [Trichogramma brassicae]|uniref:Uncharacterized protein n=1 Tax=Trichogramma brassicae TaxID=86971 RepID=A0A6H5I2K2_9HYME|nr:unnamed protein product [Trichogramma brassicae]
MSCNFSQEEFPCTNIRPLYTNKETFSPSGHGFGPNFFCLKIYANHLLRHFEKNRSILRSMSPTSSESGDRSKWWISQDIPEKARCKQNLCTFSPEIHRSHGRPHSADHRHRAKGDAPDRSANFYPHSAYTHTTYTYTYTPRILRSRRWSQSGGRSSLSLKLESRYRGPIRIPRQSRDLGIVAPAQEGIKNSREPPPPPQRQLTQRTRYDISLRTYIIHLLLGAIAEASSMMLWACVGAVPCCARARGKTIVVVFQCDGGGERE